jgi:hypothetical protein
VDVRLSHVIKSGAAVVAAVVTLGLVGALPAYAAPKPRLPITITSQPASVSASPSATFSWTSSVAGATFTCSLDGAVGTACTSPKSYTGLADGSHTFVVKGKKNGSNRPGSATVRWTVDTVPPGAPAIAPVASPTKNTTAVISFTNADPSAVAHTCALDGNAAVACQSPWTVVPSPLAEGSHTVVVQSKDAFGTLGGTSSVTWVVDATAPAAVVLSGPTSPTNTALATFTFSSADATSYTCALDGGAAVACTSGYSLTVAEGQHTMVVTGFDAASNASLPGTATWALDTTAPPTPSILTGPATTTNQTGVDFLVDNPDSSATLQCRLDGGLWTTCPSPLHFTVGSQGAHTLQVRAVDAAGNASAPTASFDWTLDTTAPQPAQFLAGPDSPTAQTTAEFDFVPTDAADATFDSFVCSYDGSGYVACDTDSVPVPATVTEGSHTLAVKVVDTAANLSAPATWSWVVDVTAPGVPQFSMAPASPTTDRVAKFVFESAGATTFTCSVDGGTALPCVSPFTLTGVSLI